MRLACCASCGCVTEVRGEGRDTRIVGHAFRFRGVEEVCAGSGRFPMLPMSMRQPVANDNRQKRK